MANLRDICDDENIRMDDLDTEPTFRSIAKLAGADAAIKLAAHYGGGRLSIPLTAQPDNRITKAVGMDAAKKLSAVYGGASYSPSIMAARKYHTARLLLEGLSASQIAIRMFTTRRDVFRIKREIKEHGGIVIEGKVIPLSTLYRVLQCAAAL